MFGMTDPQQVVSQFRRYAEEGRLEIAEVMSGELSERLSRNKDRSTEEQRWLVEALRDHTSILHQRGKFKKSLKSWKMLNKERKKLLNIAKTNKLDNAVLEINQQIPLDFLLGGNICTSLGKLGPAKSNYSKAIKTCPGFIDASRARVDSYLAIKGNLKKATSATNSFIQILESSGQVNKSGGKFVFMVDNQNPVDATMIVQRMEVWASDSNGLNTNTTTKLRGMIEDYKSQMNAIESGLQAANAKLAAAVDKLNPTMDYHTYSRN